MVEEMARRRGRPIVLPGPGLPAERVDADDVIAGRVTTPDRVLPEAEAMLSGALTLRETGYRDVRRLLRWRGGSVSWTVEAVSFDVAIRDGLERSALRLSGNVKR